MQNRIQSAVLTNIYKPSTNRPNKKHISPRLMAKYTGTSIHEANKSPAFEGMAGIQENLCKGQVFRPEKYLPSTLWLLHMCNIPTKLAWRPLSDFCRLLPLRHVVASSCERPETWKGQPCSLHLRGASAHRFILSYVAVSMNIQSWCTAKHQTWPWNSHEFLPVPQNSKWIFVPCPTFHIEHAFIAILERSNLWCQEAPVAAIKLETFIPNVVTPRPPRDLRNSAGYHHPAFDVHVRSSFNLNN